MSRDPLVTFCMASGLALDSETYIALAYPQGKRDPWTAEHEAELPALFPRTEKVGINRVVRFRFLGRPKPARALLASTQDLQSAEK